MTLATKDTYKRFVYPIANLFKPVTGKNLLRCRFEHLPIMNIFGKNIVHPAN